MFGIAGAWGHCCCWWEWGEGFRSGTSGDGGIRKDIMFLFPGRAPAVQRKHELGAAVSTDLPDYEDVRTQAPHVRRACPDVSRSDLKEVSEFAERGGEILGAEPQLNESVTFRSRKAAG